MPSSFAFVPSKKYADAKFVLGIAEETVTEQTSEKAPAVAVIVVVPAFKAFTAPFITVATAGSLLVHVTDGSVALSGLTVACQNAVS